MNRINLIALGAALSLAVLAPSASPAQGKGKGGEKEKAGPPAKVESRGYQKADRGQDKGRQDDAARAEKSNRDNSAKANRVKSDDVNKGQRGVERRSDRANAVAAGPNPANRRLP